MKVLSIRQAVETALLTWLTNSFQGKDEFAGVTFSKGQTSIEVEMPLVCGLCPNAEEVEVPGTGIYRATATIVLMTSVDVGTNPTPAQREANDAAHKARCDCVANKTEDIAGLIAELSATNTIFVYGVSLGKSSNEVTVRHFIDSFELILMCRCT